MLISDTTAYVYVCAVLELDSKWQRWRVKGITLLRERAPFQFCAPDINISKLCRGFTTDLVKSQMYIVFCPFDIYMLGVLWYKLQEEERQEDSAAGFEQYTKRENRSIEFSAPIYFELLCFSALLAKAIRIRRINYRQCL